MYEEKLKSMSELYKKRTRAHCRKFGARKRDMYGGRKCAVDT